jgi:hypothetical protein
MYCIHAINRSSSANLEKKQQYFWKKNQRISSCPQHAARTEWIDVFLAQSLCDEYMFLFMNFALIEHSLAYFQLRQSKLSLPYQQHTVLVLSTNKSMPNVDKLPLSVLRAVDPVSLSAIGARIEDHSDMRCANLTWDVIKVVLMSMKLCLLFQLTLRLWDA